MSAFGPISVISERAG